MEFLRKELSNKNKIKIKTFSELYTLNVHKTKKFPILTLNLKLLDIIHNQMEKLHQIIIRNKKELQKGKNIDLEKENKELRKK